MINESIVKNVGKGIFIERVLENNPRANTKLIEQAYDFAMTAHSGQKRVSGDEYFEHVMNVAYILADMHMDSETVAAALLHDVLEDTKVSKKQLEKLFGKSITGLVEGVTKTISLKTTPEDRAENIRKVLLATIKDIRVIFLKLADRLHNMRTLKFLSPEKQKEISRETLEVYVPIAYKIGMYRIKSELEDLCMRFLEPELYQELKNKISKKKEVRDKEVKRIVSAVNSLLVKNKMPVRVFGRAKNFYSIYKKMRKKEIPFEEIRDLYAIRVVTVSPENCYKILSLVHSKWTPIPNRFDDYISHPKPNMYQSLHTEILFDNKPVEVQVRSLSMHHVAEEGLAAHWRYKDTERDKQFDRKITWLKQILEWRSSESAKDFVESLKVDMFKDEIYVMTPKGDAVHLPEKATPIDFAYAVHTEIGSKCRAAKVNGAIVPLDYELSPGDVVEIITSKVPKPSRQWLRSAKTAFARNKIRKLLGIKGDEARNVVLTSVEILSKLDLKDVKKSLYQVPGCCDIKYRSRVVGIKSKDGHITLHHKGCDGIKPGHKSKLIKFSWMPETEKYSSLIVEITDRVGIFADLLNTITSEHIKVESVNTKSAKHNLLISFEISGLIDVKQKNDLNKKLKSISNVESVRIC
jgi:GTP diphosphokinase / guanosine-3',5'-bis(diphosphate) 3'-diphosphatase